MKKTFAEYYSDLLRWEGEPHCQLISKWAPKLIGEVKADFERAVNLSQIKGTILEVRDRSSNQSIGNQVEVYTVTELNKGLKTFLIENCVGAGYPDRLLARGAVKNIALEMKATSFWDDTNSNRTVLTSSSAKLIRA